MNDKQKMGTALGAYKDYKSHVRLDAPGLSPLFCGFGTYVRKKSGTVPSPGLYGEEPPRMKSGPHYSLRQYVKLRREQSPFFSHD